jgi:hypothetical protein
MFTYHHHQGLKMPAAAPSSDGRPLPAGVWLENLDLLNKGIPNLCTTSA